jgi:hypothetical protein
LLDGRSGAIIMLSSLIEQLFLLVDGEMHLEMGSL